MEVTPDTKDWTWVLDRQCPECGFDARSPERGELAALARLVGRRWVRVIAEVADARTRPKPGVWSPGEYACHVRDVFGLAKVRVGLMVEEDDPVFENWDQDRTAVDDDYPSQDPGEVAADLYRAASAFAAGLDSLPDAAWSRRGRRSDGAAFTVDSFAHYLLHDPIHHLTDVTQTPWIVRAP